MGMIRKLLYLGIAHLCLAADPEVFENYFDDSVKEVDISLDSAIKGCLQNGNGLADKVKSAYGNCFGKDYDFDDLAKKDGSGDSDNDGLPDTFENNEACFYEKMGWINAAGNLDPDVIKNDLTGLDEDLKAAFDGNIDKCAAWNGNFGSSRKKRGTGETDTDDVAPSIMEKEGSVLGWLKSALRKTRSADPQKNGNGKKGKGRNARKGKSKKKKGKKTRKGKNGKGKKGGKNKARKGKKKKNKTRKGGKSKGKNGRKKKNRKAKKGKNKKNRARKGGKKKGKKGGKNKRNRKAKKGGKGKGKKGGNKKNRKAKKGKKPKGKKGKARKGKKGKGSKNKKNRARSGKSKAKGKDRNKKTKGKGNKGKGKGNTKGKGKENGRSSSQMAESIYNPLWCFDLSLEQVLEQCVENKIKN